MAGGFLGGLFGGGGAQTAPVHAAPQGGLLSQASRFLGGIGSSIGNLFTPHVQASTPAAAPTTPPPTARAPITQQVTARQVPTAPPPLSSGTISSSTYNPQIQQQNYAPVAQAESALSTYLAGRDPAAYLTQQYQQLGIPDLQKVLTNETSDILNQQQNLTDLPKADIARRSDSGMLTAAQRNALTSSEQAPLRDQLLRSESANSADTQKLNSLLQLANNYLGAYNQGTSAGETPYTQGIQGAEAAYTAAQNAADRAASEKSTVTQNEALQNRQMQLAGNMSQEVKQGATLAQMMGKYLAQGLDPDTILSLYNANSTFGPATYKQYAKGDQPGKPSTNLTDLYGIAAARGA